MNNKQDKEDSLEFELEQNELLKIIINTTQTKIFWKDAKRRFLGANKAFLDYYGFPSLEMILGKTDEDMGWHDDPNPFKNDEVQVLQKGISISRVHGKCLSHGEERDILVSKSPVYKDGHIVGLVGSFDDVTDEYRQKNELGKLTQTLNGLPAGIAVFKPWRDTYICVSVNDYFADMVGATREKFVGKKINELLQYMHPEDRVKCMEAAKNLTGSLAKMSGTFRYIHHATGEYLWLFTEGRLVKQRDGERYIYYNYINVSELVETKLAEESMRHQYESSIEAAKLFLWVYDVKNHIITMESNPYTIQCCQNLGFSMKMEDIPRTLLPYCDEVSKASMEKVYADVDAGVPYASCEVTYNLPGRAQPKHVSISLTTVFDAEGKPFKAYGVSRDITEEKQVQQRYEHELSYIHAEDNKNFIAKAHSDLTANKLLEYIRITGDAVVLDNQISYDEGCKIFEQLPVLPKDKETYSKLFNRVALLQAFANGTYNFNFECRHNQKLHAVNWVSTEARLLCNPNNGHIESFMYSYDVTDKYLRQQLMANLRDLGYKFLGMINTASGSATFYDMDPKFDRWQVWMEVDDYPDKAVQIIRETVAEEEQAEVIEKTKLSTIVEKLQTEGEYSCSYNRVDKVRGMRRILVQYRYLDEEKKDIFLCATDNTEDYLQEQKQIEQLKAVMLEAAKANEAKSSFLSSISHDMRTPLNGILGFTDLALNTRNQAQKQDYLTKIAASGSMMLDLVNDVLDLSKVESGKMELYKEVFPVAEFVDAVLASVQQSAKDKEIALTSEIQTKDFVYIREDKTRLQQIMLNILSNAIKYTPRQGHVHFCLKNYPTDKDGYNTVAIFEDDGIGMSEEYLPRIFEPFSQEHAKEAEGVQGTGLGMSIVKKIIDLMGGKIEVKSARGKGTTFTVHLHIEKVAEPDKVVVEKTSRQYDESILRGKRILVCEDNRMNVEIIQALLKGRGMLVENADDGQEAVNKFSSSGVGYYDVILMDIRMPVMDGLEATKAIRTLDKTDAKTIPIIANSADVFKEEVEKFLAAGMNNCVPKPIDKNRLYEVLIEELSKRDISLTK